MHLWQGTGYDETIARKAASWSSAAYGHTSVDLWDFVHDCATLHPTSIQPFSSPTYNSFGYAAVDVELRQVILAFSGTKNLNDLITDFDSNIYYSHACNLPSLDDGQPEVTYAHVHEGFCDYYKSLAEAGLTAEAMKLADANPEFSVLVTGHSLGAAAAVIAAVDLAHRFKLDVNRILLYTFGGPRIGDGEFKRETKSPLPPLLPFCCSALF